MLYVIASYVQRDFVLCEGRAMGEQKLPLQAEPASISSFAVSNARRIILAIVVLNVVHVSWNLHASIATKLVFHCPLTSAKWKSTS